MNYGPRKRVLTPRVQPSEDIPAAFEVPTKMKRLTVINPPNSAMWQIKYEGGGEVPDELKGMYTSEGKAIQDINRFSARFK